MYPIYIPCVYIYIYERAEGCIHPKGDGLVHINIYVCIYIYTYIYMIVNSTGCGSCGGGDQIYIYILSYIFFISTEWCLEKFPHVLAAIPVLPEHLLGHGSLAWAFAW